MINGVWASCFRRGIEQAYGVSGVPEHRGIAIIVGIEASECTDSPYRQTETVLRYPCLEVGKMKPPSFLFLIIVVASRDGASDNPVPVGVSLPACITLQYIQHCNTYRYDPVSHKDALA